MNKSSVRTYDLRGPFKYGRDSTETLVQPRYSNKGVKPT